VAAFLLQRARRSGRFCNSVDRAESVGNQAEVLIATHDELESTTKTGLAHATAKASEPAAKLPGESLSGGEVALLAVELVVLKGEKCEFRTVFVAIGRLFEDQHVLCLDSGGRTHDPASSSCHLTTF
jgi:hypothetical protein